jgi:hypothetical protein
MLQSPNRVCLACESEFKPRSEGWILATFLLGFLCPALWLVTIYLHLRRFRCVLCGGKETVPKESAPAKKILSAQKAGAVLLALMSSAIYAESFKEFVPLPKHAEDWKSICPGISYFPGKLDGFTPAESVPPELIGEWSYRCVDGARIGYSRPVREVRKQVIWGLLDDGQKSGRTDIESVLVKKIAGKIDAVILSYKAPPAGVKDVVRILPDGCIVVNGVDGNGYFGATVCYRVE